MHSSAAVHLRVAEATRFESENGLALRGWPSSINFQSQEKGGQFQWFSTSTFDASWRSKDCHESILGFRARRVLFLTGLGLLILVSSSDRKAHALGWRPSLLGWRLTGWSMANEDSAWFPLSPNSSWTKSFDI